MGVVWKSIMVEYICICKCDIYANLLIWKGKGNYEDGRGEGERERESRTGRE